MKAPMYLNNVTAIEYLDFAKSLTETDLVVGTFNVGFVEVASHEKLMEVIAAVGTFDVIIDVPSVTHVHHTTDGSTQSIFEIIHAKRPHTFWLTYSLAAGIEFVEGTVARDYPARLDMPGALSDSSLVSSAYHESLGWHRTLEAAEARMEIMKQNEIQSLRARISRLDGDSPSKLVKLQKRLEKIETAKIKLKPKAPRY